MSLHIVKKEIIKDESIKTSTEDSFNLQESVDNFWNYVNSYEPPLVVGVFSVGIFFSKYIIINTL